MRELRWDVLVPPPQCKNSTMKRCKAPAVRQSTRKKKRLWVIVWVRRAITARLTSWSDGFYWNIFILKLQRRILTLLLASYTVDGAIQAFNWFTVVIIAVSASVDMKCHWWAIGKELPADDNGKRMRGYGKPKWRSHKAVKLWWREIQRSWSAILPNSGRFAEPRSFTTNAAVWIWPLLYNWKNNLVRLTSKGSESVISFHCGLVSLTSLRKKI